MKLNWGHYIVISFTAFVILILYMVFRSYQNNHDLVAEDYYDRELQFQEVINKRSKASKLERNISWEIRPEALLIKYPKMETKIKGTIVLFRPSDKQLDLSFEIEPDSNNEQLLQHDNLSPGKYLVEIHWSAGEDEYYTDGAAILSE